MYGRSKNVIQVTVLVRISVGKSSSICTDKLGLRSEKCRDEMHACMKRGSRTAICLRMAAMHGP